MIILNYPKSDPEEKFYVIKTSVISVIPKMLWENCFDILMSVLSDRQNLAGNWGRESPTALKWIYLRIFEGFHQGQHLKL